MITAHSKRSYVSAPLLVEPGPRPSSLGTRRPENSIQGSWLQDLAIRNGWSSSTACRAMRTRNRSEEHTSELQSLMRISYAVFCLKKKKTKKNTHTTRTNHNQTTQ